MLASFKKHRPTLSRFKVTSGQDIVHTVFEYKVERYEASNMMYPRKVRITESTPPFEFLYKPVAEIEGLTSILDKAYNDRRESYAAESPGDSYSKAVSNISHCYRCIQTGTRTWSRTGNGPVTYGQWIDRFRNVPRQTAESLVQGRRLSG